ncbi:phosphodiester glycosidase family protein [Jannaschia aquimarina]|uniref:Phosphodiester glycosidase domain-containing protein n=1 Tax=Jannaschia aquimarina TaxID=935700 RepID=A0A0D1EI13_9RHOB|nr:phosphodiester glycosidase family protein [Jannaschia aquimarina]KIT15485.1 hypothetical protein jaqu_27330 [Jannaschia aquimarina]SNT34017.1 Uncharacterized protein YigE, DUF2233 family [Jannaschia aquimarina]
MIRLVIFLILLPFVTAAEPCETAEHKGSTYVICTADLSRHRIDLHLTGPDGSPLYTFAAMEAAGGAALFAMNAGMYHRDRAPVGLYIEDGHQSAPLVTRAGPGNFGMLPNGLLCIEGARARVIESRAYAADPPDCTHATQSGPMLVIDGDLHPRFIPDSPYTAVRNGVGATPDGERVHFVISEGPVPFHDLATLFRDRLGVRDALYLDGRVSKLHAPVMGRSDRGLPMGPIVAVRPR